MIGGDRSPRGNVIYAERWTRNAASHLGVAEDADTIIVLMRAALFADGEAKKRYLSSAPFAVRCSSWASTITPVRCPS